MISIVSFSESRGGAAKATHKVFLALRNRGVAVQYVVVEKFSTDDLVIAPGRCEFLRHFIKRLISFLLQKLQASKNLVKHSINLFSCASVLRAIQESEIVHLNWINNETIALEKLLDINANLIITLHDEWFYCGSEHLALQSRRFAEGYSVSNKNIFGIDWDRITWNRKNKVLNAIKNKVVFTVPSTWMLARAKESYLLRNSDVRLIPNIINTAIFRRTNSDFLTQYGVTVEDRVILFGAIHGKNMQIKGLQLLREALSLLASALTDKTNVVLVTFGGKAAEPSLNFGFRQVEVGHIDQPSRLAELYSRADFTVVPSLVESFGQVAAESLSCETPVIAFDCSGLRDIVIHKINGYLAEPYSSKSLCAGMMWMLMRDSSTVRQMGSNGRRHVVERFSESIVAEKLLSLYRELGLYAPKSI